MSDQGATSPGDALGEGLFFLVGSPRSGTTLVQAMLTAHPSLGVPPETEFFMKFEPPEDAADGRAWEAYLARYFDSRAWKDQGLDAAAFAERAGATDRSARAVFLTLMAMQAERLGKPRMGEKSPHHCRHVERIAELFPSARFIHIYRDPRDVVASLMQVPWSEDTPRRRARGWRRLAEEHERLARTMPEGRYTALRFESLLDDPEGEMSRILAFLGEPFDRSVLRFHERTDAGFDEREADWKARTTKPLDKAAAGAFRAKLSERQIESVQREVGAELMRRFGYEPDAIVPGFMWWWFDFLDAVVALKIRARKARRRRLKRWLGIGDSA